MNEKDEKTPSAETQERRSGLCSYILPLAVKTLIACLVLFSLIFALVGSFAPKAYMNLYHSFGNDGMATYYAAAAVKRAGEHPTDCDGTCDLSALLTTAMSCAENTEGHFDRKLMFAEKYLALPCHEKHSAIVDGKYIEGNDLSRSGLTVLSAIYGYDDYVSGVRMEALCGSDFAAATREITEKAMTERKDTALMNELIAYTDFGDYSAFGSGELLGNVREYFSAISEGASADVEAYGKGNPDIRKAADIASRLGRLYDLAYNMNKAEQGINAASPHFTSEVVRSVYNAYKGFIDTASAPA